MRASPHVVVIVGVISVVLTIAADCFGMDWADTSSGPDVDPDTDSDTATCTYADVVLETEVRTTDGSPCTTCPAAVPLDLVARATNPCPDAVELVTASECLVGLWTVERVGEDGVRGELCDLVFTVRALDAGASVEEVYAWSPLEAGDHVVTAEFTDAAFTVVTQPITVQ